MTFTTARGEETTSVRGVSATSAAGSAGVTETAKSLEENISLVHPDGTTDTSAYTAPVKLGNNVQNMQMQLDGTLYQFPFPVSELLADAGQETDGSMYEKNEDEGYIDYTLRYLGKKMTDGV